jgi:hypothetical protein
VIDCERARGLIDGFVMDDLLESDRRALADHLRGCAACTAELGSATRLLELLATLPDVPVTEDFDERVVAAALADRSRRHERRSWLTNLPTQFWRGAVRTTGTLMLTVALVALVGAAFVFAASNLFPGLVPIVGVNRSTPTPRPTPTAQPTAQPTPTPVIVIVTAPAPTPTKPEATPVTPTQAPTEAPTATPSPSPSPTPIPTATPTVEPSPTATPAPTEPPTATPTAPTPTPTDKRRTPPPTLSP